jgi:hypothetical protein|tara:strand:- start:1631 stop:1801 length:171 start_codon:yes stop_codon:yes gene_type:complete
MIESGKEALDIAAGSTALLALGAWLPPVSSLFAILWFAIRIWESDTVKEITGRDAK